MKFYKKLERSIGRFAIPKLYIYIVAAVILSYILYYMLPNIYYLFPFYPYEVVVKHQYWRLFTWILTIPYTLNSGLTMMLLPFSLFFYFWIGKGLEFNFGKFAFNLYVFGGWFFSTAAVLILSLYYYSWSSDASYYVSYIDGLFALGSNSMVLGEYPLMEYLLNSIYFAFALVYGEYTVMLFMAIPVKVKWSAILVGFYMAYDFLRGNMFTRVLVICSIINFIIFYNILKNLRGSGFRDTLRRKKFQKKMMRGGTRYKTNEDGTVKFPTSNKPIHRCVICGRTEKDDPNLEFRYCSKCNGDKEYCSDHLYTHEHVI